MINATIAVQETEMTNIYAYHCRIGHVDLDEYESHEALLEGACQQGSHLIFLLILEDEAMRLLERMRDNSWCDRGFMKEPPGPSESFPFSFE